MRITRKVFSIYSEEDLISAIEEKAFCEGYQAAQKEFAEEESRDRNRKIGIGLTGIGAVGAGNGLGKTLYDVHDNKTFYNKQINDLVADNKEVYDKRINQAKGEAEWMRNSAKSRYDKSLKEIDGEIGSEMKMLDEKLSNRGKHLKEIDSLGMEKIKLINRHNDTLKRIDSDLEKEVKGIEEKFGKEVTDREVNKIKGKAALNRGKIIKSGALKYGLPALAVTGIGAGMMYKNRKNKD